MNIILGLYYLHEKNHAVTEKETFVRGVYRTITLEIKINDFIEENFILVKNKYESLDKKVEGSEFCLNYASK